jgi:predicted porin
VITWSGRHVRPPIGGIACNGKANSPDASMNPRLLAVVTLSLFGGGALAQSSPVTMFGIVDLALRSVSNDETQYQLASGGIASSRFGMRGSEHLGGDLSAGFWLEGALDPDTGNANGFDFRRRSTVSLVSKSLGELRLGRDKVPTYFAWETYSPFRDAGVGNSTRLSQASGIVPAGGAYSTFVRTDNAMAYFLPERLGGFFGQVTVSAGEGNLGSRYVGGSVGYRSGGLSVNAAYGTTEVTADEDAKTWNVGGWYDFEVVRLMGFYSSLEIGDGSQTNWLLGATAPLGGFELRASYQAMAGDGTLAGQDAAMVAFGAVYALSRRTALYGTWSYIDNDGTRFTVASGSPLTAGHASRGYEFGMRHAF